MENKLKNIGFLLIKWAQDMEKEKEERKRDPQYQAFLKKFFKGEE